MYGRNVDDRTLAFNTSGALFHNALVMMDDQTDSFWSIISSKAIGGDLVGKQLNELTIAEKTTWGAWLDKHPNTLLLSVNNKVHIDNNPYDNYFTSDDTFRNAQATDDRLPAKAAIFTLELAGQHYAFTHEAITGGDEFKIKGRRIFVYRTKPDVVYRSTKAWRLNHDGKEINLKQRRGQWRAKDWGPFDPATGRFTEQDIQLEAIGGLDTFWYIWSAYYPDTKIKAD